MKLVGILLCCLVSRVFSVPLLQEKDVLEDSCESENDDMIASPLQGCGVIIQPSNNSDCVNSNETQVMFSCLYKEETCKHSPIIWNVNGESVSDECDFVNEVKIENGSQLYITNLTILHQGYYSVNCCICDVNELKCAISGFYICIPSLPMTTPKLGTATQEMQKPTTKLGTTTQETQTPTPKLGTTTKEMKKPTTKPGITMQETQKPTSKLRTTTKEMKKQTTKLGATTQEMKKPTPKLGTTTQEMQTPTPELGKTTQEKQKTTPEVRSTAQEMQQTTTMAWEQTQSNLGVIVGVSITCGVGLLAGAFVFTLFYSKRQRKARKADHNQLQALHTEVTCNEYVDSTMVMTTVALVGSSVAMSANLAHNIYQEVDNIRSPRNNEVTGSENHVTNIDVSDGPNRDDIDRLYAKPNKGNKQLRHCGGEASNGEVDHDPSQLYAKPNKWKKNLRAEERAYSDQTPGDGIDHLYAKPDKKNKQSHEERSHELHS